MASQSTDEIIADPFVALAFMTEATLVTISDLANRSRPPRRELARQIEIAQTGIAALKCDPSLSEGVMTPWVHEIINGQIDVRTWCEKWR